MNREKLLELLEEMPINKKKKRVKIAETAFALSELHMSGQLDLTMQDIKNHNWHARGYEEGYQRCIDELKEWRNQKYLEIKGMV